MKIKRKKEKEMKMEQVTLYHRKASGKVKIWSCTLRGREVLSTWGQMGGEMNSTREVAKPNSLATAEEKARAVFEKKVKKYKTRRGYVECLEDVVESINVVDARIDFDKPLPKDFAPAKPIKEVDPDEVARWVMKDLIYIQRKRDGMRHFIKTDNDGTVRIYSSGKDDMTEHLWPLLVDLKLPPKTIIDCELVVTEPGKEERDGFLIVSGIARSLPERARKMIALAQGMGASVQLMAFDLLFEEGVPVYKRKYEERYRRLAKVIENADQATDERTLVRMPLLSISPTRLAKLNEAIEMVEKFKWEGLVIWRKDQATVVQVNGSPKRVNCYKVKPIQEEDVVAVAFEKGKGKNANVVGNFNIAVYKGKQLVPMGNCGSGMDDATRKAALSWTYPCVIQIEYDKRSASGFRFPIFIRKRDDKKPADCR